MSDDLIQAPLFDESQLPAGRELLMPETEQRKRFTGEHVARNRERYDGIVAALGEGLGVRQIARAFGVSQHTIEAIRERDAALVATLKERTGAQLRRLVRMSLEALEEALAQNKIAPGQLPVAAGILIDKSLLWDGQATAIVSVRREIDQDQVRAMFEALVPPPGPIVDVEVLSPESQSGIIGPEPQQIDLNSSHEATCEATFDSPNTTSAPQGQASSTTSAPASTDLAPAPAPAPATPGRGGEGGRVSESGPASSWIDPRKI